MTGIKISSEIFGSGEERALLDSTELFDELVSLWSYDFPEDNILVVETALRVRNLAELERAALQEVLAEFDIAVGDADVLLILSRQQASELIRPSDLAALCNVTTGAMTGRLDRLQARRYVDRIKSDKDKRTSFVRLTTDGTALGLKIRRALKDRSKFLSAIRSIPDQELNQLNHLLKILIRRLVTAE